MRYVLATLCLSILTACGTPKTGTVETAVSVETVCSIWPSTTYSRRDTDQTIRGNRLNNARREGFCEGTSAATRHFRQGHGTVPTPSETSEKPAGEGESAPPYQGSVGRVGQTPDAVSPRG